MSRSPRGTVLISGASIAGPALAFWLNRYGFRVTVVEKAGALRGGGYPIDIRGTALEVVRRMGVLPRLRAAHVGTRKLTFLDSDGGLVASLRPEAVAGGVEGRDLEVRRTDLAEALYDAVRDDVEFLFNDSIAALDDHEGGVDVTFHGGAGRTYDFVVGADGLHSNTRRLVFGPEEQFHHYLGYCFAGFTMRNDFDLSSEGVVWNAPGRGAALYAVGGSDELHGFLVFTRTDPPFDAFRDPVAQRELVASVFAGDGWEIPRMTGAMRTADDLFFDVVSQIRMPRWSAGRVALVGDAAYAPSFMTGQGSSVALVGAYMLAGGLATEPTHTEAFAAYERGTRPFVELNQAIVSNGSPSLFPRTAEDLRERDDMLRRTPSLPADTDRAEFSSLTLPNFAVAT
jgi:2-polyprenyl-6-methoxyphenol hydroxylase-like FAD-dependent oxidoreductase